jgi:hypothetical protein
MEAIKGISTSQFNKDFNEIVGIDQTWDFQMKRNGLIITKNGGTVFNLLGSLKPLDEQRAMAIEWLKNNFK